MNWRLYLWATAAVWVALFVCCLAWLAVAWAAISWPFARQRLEGTATGQEGRLNKALVALFACLTVAAAATSVATNLARVR